MKTRSPLAATVLVAVLLAASGSAQTPATGPGAPPPPQAPQAGALVGESVFDQAIRTATVAEETATLSYANRHIIVFRATVLSRTPAERAAGAHSALDRLVDAAPWGRAASSVVGAARII